MRVLIDPEVELFPQVTLLFGDDEIVFPSVSRAWEKTAGREVPDDVAARWKAARDAWRAAQNEARIFIGYAEEEL